MKVGDNTKETERFYHFLEIINWASANTGKNLAASVRKNRVRTLEVSEKLRPSLFTSLDKLKFCHTGTENVAETN